MPRSLSAWLRFRVGVPLLRGLHLANSANSRQCIAQSCVAQKNTAPVQKSLLQAGSTASIFGAIKTPGKPDRVRLLSLHPIYPAANPALVYKTQPACSEISLDPETPSRRDAETEVSPPVAEIAIDVVAVK